MAIAISVVLLVTWQLLCLQITQINAESAKERPIDRFVGSWQVFYKGTGNPVQNSEDEDDLLVTTCVKLSDLELACSSTNKAGKTQTTNISWDGVDTVKVKLERGPDVEGVYDGDKTITWKSPADKKWIKQNLH